MTRLGKWLDYHLAHVPLRPPPFWRRPAVWVAWGLMVLGLDVLLPGSIDLLPLCLVPVGLAAWNAALGWSLGLALGLPWGRLLSWWVLGQDPWPLGVEFVNMLSRLVIGLAIALLVTALQRHASRLALERDPRLPPDTAP